jgi:hypothetical protein
MWGDKENDYTENVHAQKLHGSPYHRLGTKQQGTQLKGTQNLRTSTWHHREPIIHTSQMVSAPEVYTEKNRQKNSKFGCIRVAKRDYSKKNQKKERKATLTPLV